MDTKIYTVDLSILLTPVANPQCKISIGDQLQELSLVEPTWIDLQLQGSGPMQLVIEHHGKRNHDPTTALIIEEIKFDDISNPRFVWEGIYRPSYPYHMSGDEVLKYHSYLGWNGIWTLDFSLPIYTWMHQIENLGWIYD